MPIWNNGCPKCGKKNGNKYKCTNCNVYGCRTRGCLGDTAKCEVCSKSGTKKLTT